MQYLEQNFVTNIQFIKFRIVSLPAYTICYDRFLSFDNLFKRFADTDFVKEMKDNYSELMSKVSKMSLEEIDSELMSQIQAFDDQHLRLQKTMMNEIQPPYIYSKLSGYQDFFENITIHGTYFENNQTKYYYRPWLTGHIWHFWYENDPRIFYLLNIPLNINPIESMYYLGDSHRKCFTFFSHLQRIFLMMKANLKRVTLIIPFPSEWFPYRKQYEIYPSVHSANIIPQSNTFSTIEELGEYTVIYSTVENQENLAGLSCSDYDLEYKHGNFNMKSDCLFHCLRDKLGSNCDLNIMEKLSHIPFRQTLFPDKVPNEQCQFDNNQYYIKDEECSRICLDECHQEYYFQEIKQIRNVQPNTPMDQRSIRLYLEPSSLPKIIVTHSPEMTFMTLFCNFGGLLGIWMGVSMLTTMNNVWHLVKKALAKLQTINNFKKNKLFIENNYYHISLNRGSQSKSSRRRRFTGFNYLRDGRFV